MNSNRVYILGGYQTDFACNWHREGKTIFDLLSEGVQGACNTVNISPSEIQCAHIGNFVGELFCKQGLLGGLFASIHPDLAGIPTMRHEAACASGSMAALAAMADIESGRYDLACVSGIEMMRNVDGKTASGYLGAAAWHGKEAGEALFPWVHLFSQIAEHYKERYGLKHEHLAAIAKNNYANSKNNPNAHTRSWALEDDYYGENDELNPIVEGVLRRSDCGRISDGCATVFLASAKYAKQFVEKRNIQLDTVPYIKGWGHRTAPMLLADKLKVNGSDYLFPHLRAALLDARKRANIKDVWELDAIETHDCFSISEYVAIEHFGLAGPGEGWKAVEDETIMMKGKLPVNPSGGLIGAGHPVGATGVRMLLDAYKQVSNKAGHYQVEGAKNVAALNIGGSFTAVASFVVGKN